MSADSLDGQAHLYLASPDDWTSGDQLDRSIAVLSSAERQRYERFRVAAPARAFATGRALARQTLSLYADSRPADWRLEPDEHGRPRILGAGGLEFNLSHNDRLVACLVTAGGACGVDVEWLERRVDPLRIAEHSFCEPELDDLSARTAEDRQHRFFAYWTLKEAYLKARGRGIEMRLDSALFRFPADGRIEVELAERTADHPADWQFALFRVDADQLLAVALRRERDVDLELSVFHSRPDEPRGVATCATLAASRPPAGARR